MAFWSIRAEFINESDWISVWHFRASAPNSSMSRTGFLLIESWRAKGAKEATEGKQSPSMKGKQAG